MFNLGMGEITIILALALIVLGPTKLPELASGLGKLIREFRKATSDVKNEIQLDDNIRHSIEELREAVMLHPDELKRRDQRQKELEETRRRLAEEEAARNAAATAEEAGQPPPETGAASPAPGASPEAAPPPEPAILPPTAPPAGTVARGGLFDALPATDAPAPAPPPTASPADRANATQFLSEADLMPATAVPPKPPVAAAPHRPTPPPPPRRPTPPPTPPAVKKG